MAHPRSDCKHANVGSKVSLVVCAINACAQDSHVGVCAKCPRKNADVHVEVKPRGLGDTVAKITKAIGIKPCGGCEKRRELLNKLVPYEKTA